MPGWLKEWWPVIALLVPLVIGWLLWTVRIGLASKAELSVESVSRGKAIEEVEQRLSEDLSKLNMRMLTIEQEVRHLPTAEDFSELRNEVTRVGTLVVASTRELESVGRALSRVEDHLMKRPS
ncbi:hypothetical protein [Azorhizobium sp. AG788]|uniref:hypothetical protein n=1 Tax=Azorhizobium sp. AG788 TaxID=2183897 RepID=UPI003138F1BE